MNYFIFILSKSILNQSTKRTKSIMKRFESIAGIIFITLMLNLLNFYCHKQSKKEVLNEETFIQVYCDVVTYADLVTQKMRDAFVDSVLSHHHITREIFQRTIDSYSVDEKKWERVFKKIVAELERREKAMETKPDSLKTD